MAKGTVERIYSGALAAFSELGYADASMELIAERAGVVKRTLYNHFATKEELFKFVLQRGINRLTALLKEAFAEGEMHEDKWTRVMRRHLEFFEENREFCRLLLQTIWGANVPLQDVMREYFACLDREIRKDQEEGRIDRELDVMTVSGALFGLVSVPAVRAVLNGQAVTEPSRMRTITKIALEGLGKYEAVAD
ncbi:MAG: TetR/AcrR family transcriptional regulator [Calditerricola sp.]|nr:TetR/AcrR family transcriptional regulator [Calditerricola sp.]